MGRCVKECEDDEEGEGDVIVQRNERDDRSGSDQNASAGGNATMEAMTGGDDDGDRSEDEWGDALESVNDEEGEGDVVVQRDEHDREREHWRVRDNDQRGKIMSFGE